MIMITITTEDEIRELELAMWRTKMWNVFFKNDYDDILERELMYREDHRNEIVDSDYNTESDTDPGMIESGTESATTDTDTAIDDEDK